MHFFMHEFKGGKNKRETEAMLREALADYNTIGYIYEPGSITVNELSLYGAQCITTMKQNIGN